MALSWIYETATLITLQCEVACKTKAYLSDVGAVSTLRFHVNGALFGKSMTVDSFSALSPGGPWESYVMESQPISTLLQRQHLTGQRTVVAASTLEGSELDIV